MKTLIALKAICATCVIFTAGVVSSTAQTFTTLVDFTPGDGAPPFSSLIQGRDGNFYGTAATGGVNDQGTVFRITPAGTLAAIHSFCGQANCMDGSYPTGALVLGVDGSLYGTSQAGGANGLGTVFRIVPKGAFSVVHSFDGADGSFPVAGLLLASDGSFYGTTSGGGTGNACGGCGTVFRVTATGALTVSHSFGGADGAFPEAPLVMGNDGNLYGTTVEGGVSSSGCYCGTVFRITSDNKFTSLHSFDVADGSRLVAPVVEATNGVFYGTTEEGGTGGVGTIFKISSLGAFATVHAFDETDGGGSDSGLVQGTDGKLYGESPDAGDGIGNIFSLALPRMLATVDLFPAQSQGGGNTGLVQSTDGKFYGTYGDPGAVFSLNTGLGPFVTFVIPTGTDGKTAQILGQGLTGTTSVTFNGIAATSFKVVADTYLIAVVPNGATTGSVVLATPGGILTSNINFRIAN
jgi:uncharacterized repeat protein (TIGR03803 family)